MNQKQIAYLYSLEYVQICDEHPKTAGRASLVHSLIKAYGLLENISIITPSVASKDDLLTFHSDDYIDCIENVQERIINALENSDDWSFENLDFDDIDEEEMITSFGLGYDCTLFKHMYDYIKVVAGGTISAAELLVNKKSDISINLNGGWHHGHADEAAGFCYVNDIVIGILKLMTKFKRILYIDLDIHHGDGVEEAFEYSKKVFTLSFHKFEDGFFPGTGCPTHCGVGPGKYYSSNVPLKDGIDDNMYCQVFDKIFSEIMAIYNPEVIVVQCGADSLARDPMGTFNLTSNAFSRCLKSIKDRNLPAMILGGGGYNLPNTARCWTQIISTVIGKALSDDIPDHDSIDKYGPSYTLCITPTNRKNENSKEYIEEVIETSIFLIRKLKKIDGEDISNHKQQHNCLNFVENKENHITSNPSKRPHTEEIKSDVIAKKKMLSDKK